MEVKRNSVCSSFQLELIKSGEKFEPPLLKFRLLLRDGEEVISYYQHRQGLSKWPGSCFASGPIQTVTLESDWVCCSRSLDKR